MTNLLDINIINIYIYTPNLHVHDQICREFQRNNCKRPDGQCRYAHPADAATAADAEGFVTVCMDFIKGRYVAEHALLDHKRTAWTFCVCAGRM